MAFNVNGSLSVVMETEIEKYTIPYNLARRICTIDSETHTP